jgi:hypothetical protein
MAEDWRRLIATLADETRRAVYASIVLGNSDAATHLTARKREKAIASLLAAGLIVESSETSTGFAADGEVFASTLTATPVTTRTGVDRFIRDGRIEQYPAKPADRQEVLEWARDRVLTNGETLAERELTDRLAQLTADPVSLRRYLVDSGFVARDPDGGRYRRAS